MMRAAVVLSAGVLALAMTGCGSLIERDCGACCKGMRNVSVEGQGGYR